jgi:HK97 gp10 family phage protein
MAKDGLNIQLENVGGFDRMLKRMAITHQTKASNVVYQSVNAGAKVVKKDAEGKAPKDVGTLRNSLKNAINRKNKKRDIFMATVHFDFNRNKGENTGDGGWHSIFIVRGTKFIKKNNFMLRATKSAEPKARKMISTALAKKIVKLQQLIVNGSLK